MNCEEIEEKLSDYIEGRLDASYARAVQDHVFSCTRCQAEAQVLAHTRRAVSSLPSVEPPPGFSRKVMTRIREEAERPGLWQRLFFPLTIKIPVHAMAILLVAGLAVYLYQANKPVQTEVARFRSLEPEPVPQENLITTDQKEEARLEPKAAPPAASLEQRSKAVDPVTSGRREQSRQDETGAQKSTQQPGRAGPKKEAEVKSLSEGIASVPMAPPPAVQMADYELTFTPNKPLEGMKVLAPKLEALVQKVGGRYLQPTEGSDMLSQDLLLRPQTVWLTLPKDRYSQFKTELASLGKIQESSIAPELPTGSMAAPKPSPESPPSLRIKLLLQLPESPE